MPGVSDIKAGRAYVEIGTKDSQLIAGLASAARRLQAFGGAIRGIGLQMALPAAAIFGPLAGAGAAYARHGEELEKSSKRTGLSVEATSTLGYAAGQTGTEAETLTNGMAKMSRTLVEAAQGSGQAQRALAQLHLTTSDLAHLSQEDRFKLIADRIAAIKDPAVQAAAAMGIFGRGGAELLPLLSQGSAGISAMQARARALGLQWSGADAAAAAKFSRVLKDMWDVLMHGVDVIGSAVAPLLTRMAEVVTNVVIVTTRWIGQHRELIGTIAAVAAGVLIAGGALVVLGTAISAVGIVLGTVAAGFGVLVTAVGALLSPIGLIVTAIVGGAVGALIYFGKTGADVTNAIVGFFKKIYDTIAFVLNNTSSMSEAWGATMMIAGTYIMQGWAVVKDYLVNLWSDFSGFMSDIWAKIGDNIISATRATADAFARIWAISLHAVDKGIQALADANDESMIRVDAANDMQNRYGQGKALNDQKVAELSRRTLTPQKRDDLHTEAEAEVRQDNEHAAVPLNDDQLQEAIRLRWQALQNSAADQEKKKLTDKYLKGGQWQAMSQDDIKALQTSEITDRLAQRQKNLQTRDNGDSELDKKLAAIKAEADAKQKALTDLREQQKAGRDQQTAQEKAANEKAAAEAEAAAKKAREAFEKALAATHKTSGDKSLADQWKDVVGPLAGKFDFKVPTPGDFSEANAGAQAKAFGTFQTGGLFGFTGSNTVAERIAKAAEETARNTRRGPGTVNPNPNTSTGDTVFN